MVPIARRFTKHGSVPVEERKKALVGNKWILAFHRQKRDVFLSISYPLPFGGRCMERLYTSGPTLLGASDDILIKEVLQTHSPDDRRIDPRPQLHLTESILNCIKMPKVHKSIKVEAYSADNEHGVGITNMDKELLCTIQKILYEMSKNRYKDVDKHGATMAFLKLLGYYSWDVKVVAVLAALVLNYGQFSLIHQLYKGHSLAFSISMLKGLTFTSEYSMEMKHCFKALDMLVKTLLDVVRCIVELGCLALGYVSIDQKEMQAVQPNIHLAVYWVIRTSVVCSCQLTSIMTERQTNPVLATWELWSYVCKVKGIQENMRKGLDFCYVRSKETLQSMFEETHADNQKVLSKLLAQDCALTLRCGSSAEKIDVLMLEMKVVILLISKPDVSLEKLLLLVQQLKNRPGKEFEGQYEIIWVPIPRSMACSPPEEISFQKLVDAFPWYYVCYPWLLSRSVIHYIQEKWCREDDLVMVVLDEKGKILSLNAIDMVLIWGPKSYPFSNLRERELWDEASWTLGFLMDEIDPHVSHLMANGRIVCLYGSKDVDWIRELSEKAKPMVKAGIQPCLVYVGSYSNTHVTDVLHLIYYEKLSYCLSHLNIGIFWSRLKSMQRSRLRLGCDNETDVLMSKINSLMRCDTESQSWAVISEGSSTDIIMLNGRRVLELFSFFETWGRNIESMGFLSAIKNSLNPPASIEHCGNILLVPFHNASGMTITCQVCSGPMEKHIVFQCSTKSS